MKNLIKLITAALLLTIPVSYLAAKTTHDLAAEAMKQLDDALKPEIITVKPTGEYATIDVAASNEVAEILLLGNSTSHSKKREIARRVEANLGYYNPMAILGLANYYLNEGCLEKYLLYGRFAIFRTIVDVKLAKDKSLDDVVPSVMSAFGNLYQQSNLTQRWNDADMKKALVEATKQIIKMDKTIPRNYDPRWPSLHSMGAFTNAPLVKLSTSERDAIIEQERQHFIEAARIDGVIIN